MIYVAEMKGQAVAGMNSDDLDEASDFLLSAVRAMSVKMFEQGFEYRLDETAPVITRVATPDEETKWEQFMAKKTPSGSRVVWFFQVPGGD